MGEIREKFDLDALRAGTFFIETDLNIYSRRLVGEPIPGSGIIVPKRHAKTVFELTRDEWLDTLDLLRRAKDSLAEEFQPDGYTIGWNVGFVAGQTVQQAHLHLIPRFDDEVKSGLGIRYWVREGNRRQSQEERRDEASPRA
ncbi:HIT family protein [Plantactinospora solaniradicis]|uniref:HIT family protein n=1 Tax=Plantactinospora solaniradicis TaxID=1723736 RepID=A0ABW1KJE5_9ACTN